MNDLHERCARLGIAPQWIGIDGITRDVPETTLRALADAFGETHVRVPDDAIGRALARHDAPACFLTQTLHDARVWGLTCQLGSLRSDRNAGMGDFADLETLVRVAGEVGADFVGLNPLHALFWADPGRISPFSPSNRAALNPLYLALDWIDEVRMDDAAILAAERNRRGDLVDVPAVWNLKDALLRDAFTRSSFAKRFAFDLGRDVHALFEAVSGCMVGEGAYAGWMTWSDAYRAPNAPGVERLLKDADFHREVAFHAWLQHLANEQLARVNRAAHEAGLRVGLYLDLAVGVSPDGSATWADPHVSVPGVKIGAPPDPFSATGQDWGLAPLSPTVVAENPDVFASQMAAVMRHAGAVRVDHAMALARLFLIPQDAAPMDGAYVRYPLDAMLDALAKVSHEARCLVIGEDLGVVPEGFRDVMARRALHAYKVFWFERDAHHFHDPAHWGRDAIACVGTHDTATLAGWWTGSDLETRRAIGQFDDDALAYERQGRARDREALLRAVGAQGVPGLQELSVMLHTHVARAPCRMAAVQIDDALGLTAQPNMPGTTDEHPNWRRRLPVAVDALTDDPGFAAHCAAMREARPK